MTAQTSSPATPTRLNPSTWSAGLQYDQAQLRPMPAQLLTLAGQGAIAPDGSVLHPGDVAAQLAAALANVVELLAAGGMELRDVLRIVIYATDVDAALAGYRALTEPLERAGATPPATLVGVTRLALPGMEVELDVTAGR